MTMLMKSRAWSDKAKDLLEAVRDFEGESMISLMEESAKLLQSIVDQQTEPRDAPIVETKMVEQPLRKLDDYREGIQDERTIEKGWELLQVTSMEGMYTKEITVDGKYKTLYEKMQLPIYILGRRRDDVMEELRNQVNGVGVLLSNLEDRKRELESALNKVEKLNEEVAHQVTIKNDYVERTREERERNRKLEKGLIEKDEEIARLKEKICAAV